MRNGAASFGSMTLVVGGLALAGLLLYGWTTGQELPVWPAVLVILVNLAAAGNLVLNIRKKQLRQLSEASAGATEQPKSGKSK